MVVIMLSLKFVSHNLVLFELFEMDNVNTHCRTCLGCCLYNKYQKNESSPRQNQENEMKIEFETFKLFDLNC